MIAVLATLKIQSGKNAEFEQTFADLAVQVRAKEPGCTVYELGQSRTDPNTYTVVELYQDQAAVDHHMKTDYFIAANGKLAPLVAAPPSLEHLDVVR